MQNNTRNNDPIIRVSRKNLPPVVKKELKAFDDVQNYSTKANKRNDKLITKAKIKFNVRKNNKIKLSQLNQMPLKRRITRQMLAEFNF